eukprot:4182736-Amphidinium_carterae.1
MRGLLVKRTCRSFAACAPLARSRHAAAGTYYHRMFATDSNTFDVFSKLKDPPEEGGEASPKKRKPSDKVLRLVDEIMSLTLIEAADLCD